MLIDCYPYEDVFARVPELAHQTDPVLRQLDALLEDDRLYQQVRADLGRRYPLTMVTGRHSTPGEAILRLLVVKHLYNWSYRETEERVADSIVLRWFCRIYFQAVPDFSTLQRWAHTIRPETLHALNDRVVQLARQAKVTRGRKLRIDGTVVETTIHHPTDSSLLADGVRVLSRIIRRSEPLVQEELAGLREAFRSRMRTMRRGLQTLHRLRRKIGENKAEQRQAVYEKLLAATKATIRQAERIHAALRAVSGEGKAEATRLIVQIDQTLPLIQQVISQARRRVLEGKKVPASEKIVSIFEPHTRIIPRHKGGADVEFGRMVVFDEVEGGIITRSAVLEDKTAEQGQLVQALEHHRQLFDRPPWLATGDRGLHTSKNERVAQDAGVTHLIIPRSGVVSETQQAKEHTRSWRRRYRWRAGIEGRLSSLRRDYGLRRCPDHGEDGFLRHLGWGVIASNLRHIGQHLAAQAAA
ncbi:MAG: ISNCY family transposase [Chloroflexota bacterium]|nr:ISNCY family transposase [Chloroflexota bacterium]